MQAIINSNKLIKSLITITIVLIIANIFDYLFGQPFWQIHRLIYFDKEANFSVWFTSSIWIIAAFMAYKCYKIASKSSGSAGKIWLTMFLLLLYFSCDETAMLHEHLGKFIEKHLLTTNLKASVFYATNIGEGILVALAILAAPFLIIPLINELRDSQDASRLLIIGFGLFVLGGLIIDSTFSLFLYKKYAFLKEMEFIIEESLEIFGAIFVTKGLMSHYKFLNEKALPDESHGFVPAGLPVGRGPTLKKS